jgi:signal transduction histidine kinase/ActR/RegA family two-component response regulator
LTQSSSAAPTDPALQGMAEVTAIGRAQFPLRVGTGVVVAGVIAMLTERWDVAALWYAAFVATLALSDAVFSAAVKGRIAGRAARLAPPVCAAVSAAAYGAVTPYLWTAGGVGGAVCAVLMLTGGSLNLLLLSHRHGRTTVAAMVPYVGYLLLAPVLTWAEAGPAAAVGVGLGVAAFFGNGAMLWRLWNDMVGAERSGRAELERQRAEAEAATEAKSAFVAMVSHELRTPISGVLTAAAELQRTATDGRQAECAGLVVQSGQFMSAVLNDLLDLAKIEAGRMTVEAVPFDLGRLTHDIGRFWALEAEARGVPLRLESAFGLPGRVIGDPTRLRQVLNNLLSNALKFTGPQGVRWSLDVGLFSGGETELIIRVTDSGPGIPEDKLERLFTPYDQTDVSLARTHGGTGLGLAISRELARLMGGDLIAESEPGRGATFVLRIKLQAAQAAPVAPRVEPEAASGPDLPLRVLVVDDHEINRRSLSLLLQPLNADVVQAVDGTDALALAGTDVFDLILMDVMMPVLDGRATVRRLRAEPGPNRYTPVIGVTGADTPEDLQACEAAGMDACVAKPLSAEALYAAIYGCLSPLEAEPERLSA